MERMVYLRSKVQLPLRNSTGSCLRDASASAAFLSIHFLPSARQSAASAGSVFILWSRKMLAPTVLFMIETSGLGSAAIAAVAAKQATAPMRPTLRANVADAAGRKRNPCEEAFPGGITPPPRYGRAAH